jgi:hypothetical protein
MLPRPNAGLDEYLSTYSQSLSSTNNTTNGRRSYSPGRIDFDMWPNFMLPGIIYSYLNQTSASVSNDASLQTSYGPASITQGTFSQKKEIRLSSAKKQIIEDKLKLIFADISAKMTPSQAVNSLNSVLTEDLTVIEMNVIEDKNVLSISDQIRIFLVHLCSQNNRTIPAVKKEAANYVYGLIQNEIKQYQNKAAGTMKFWYKRIRDENSPSIPDEIVCPLTGQIFTDPVEIHHKVIVERAAIEQWLKKKEEDPFTREPLTISELKCAPPEILKRVEDFFEKNKQSPFMHLSKYQRYKKEEIKPPVPTQPAGAAPPTPDDLLAMLSAMGHFISGDQHSLNIDTHPANTYSPQPILSSLQSSFFYNYYYNYYLNLYRLDAQRQSVSPSQENATSTISHSNTSLTNTPSDLFYRRANNNVRMHQILSEQEEIHSPRTQNRPRR